MQTVRTMIGREPRHRGAGNSCRSRRRLRAARSAAATPTSRSPASPNVPTDYRLRHPITIREADRTIANVHRLQSRRAQRRRNARKSWHSRRAGGTKPPAEWWSICRSAPATSVPPRRPCARSTRSSSASGVPPEGIVVRGYHPHGPQLRNDPHHLSEDRRASRTLRSMAGGYRAELQPRLFREPADVEHGLRHPTQPRRHGRQPGRSRAAARRDPGLHDAAHHGRGKIPAGLSPATTTRSGEQCGQDQRPRQMMRP